MFGDGLLAMISTKKKPDIILILGMNTSFREVPVMSGHPGECGELERCGHIVRILATMQQVSYRREDEFIYRAKMDVYFSPINIAEGICRKGKELL